MSGKETSPKLKHQSRKQTGANYRSIPH